MKTDEKQFFDNAFINLCTINKLDLETAKEKALKMLEFRNSVFFKPKPQPKVKKETKIPTFDEFLSFALEKEPNICKLDLQRKYNTWVLNNWKDGHDNKILNWKSKLNQTLKYIDKINGKQTTTATKQQFVFNRAKAVDALTRTYQNPISENTGE